jgi:hypothetical protein
MDVGILDGVVLKKGNSAPRLREIFLASCDQCSHLAVIEAPEARI